jgi:hypothetical protein
MDHRCKTCQRSYKKRAMVRGQLVCPYCSTPQGKQPRSITRAENNRYRELVDYKSRAAGRDWLITIVAVILLCLAALWRLGLI